MKYSTAIVLFLLLGMPAIGQDKQPASSVKLPPGVQVIRLSLHPQRAPVPALKYRLLPEVRDLKTGNAALLYYRSFSPEWQSSRRPEVVKMLNDWTENTRQVPPKELQAWILSQAALKELDLAARRSYVDWEFNDRLRQDGIHFLLPDVQGFRNHAVSLSARARLEAIDKKFDKAVYSMQTGLKLSRDVADAPTLIQALVGMAIAQQMFVQLEEMLQMPGMPNLYWSLTDLPRPFISLQKPYQGERLMIDSMFPGVREILADPKARPLSEAQVLAMLEHFLKSTAMIGASTQDWPTRLTIAAAAARSHPEAKRFLLAQGRSQADVEAMSVLQVAMLYEVHNYDRYYDELIKASTLPISQAKKFQKATEDQVRRAKADNSPGTTIAALLVPAVLKVQQATARADRRIAALRIIEAIRLYAAEHDGQLPAKLADITEVPIPMDPMTDGPFQYRVENGRATLLASPPVGEDAYAGNMLVYELSIK